MLFLCGVLFRPKHALEMTNIPICDERSEESSVVTEIGDVENDETQTNHCVEKQSSLKPESCSTIDGSLHSLSNKIKISDKHIKSCLEQND